MKIIIVGCGRMGRGVAKFLNKKGEDVTVIDNNPEAFEGLGSHFSGKTITGIGFDKEVLEQAGITMADAVVAFTNSDETNALVARIARLVYRVPKAIARLYDYHKANIYNALDVQVISTTSWGIEKTCSMLSYDQLDVVSDFGGSANVNLVRIEIPILAEGQSIREFTSMGEMEPVCIRRGNNTFVPTDGFVLKSGDILYISLEISAIPKLKSMLGMQ